MEREKWLDMGKGMAILAVVFGHLSSLNSHNNLYLWVYSFHLPVFWIISGILLSMKNYENVPMTEIIKNKFKAIMYPYVVFSIIIIAYNYVGLLLKITSKYKFGIIVENSLSLRGMNCLWFLPVLFVSEVIFILLIKHKQKVLLWGIFFAVLGTIIAVYFSKTDIFKDDPLKTYKKYSIIIPKSFFSLSFISAGYISRKFFRKVKRYYAVPAAILLPLTYNIVRIYNKKVDLNYCIMHSPKVFWFCSLLTAFSLLVICKAVQKNKLLEYLGRMSLLIMCTHRTFNLTGLGKYIISKIHFLTYGKGMLSITIEFMVVVILDIIIVEIISKWGRFLYSFKDMRKLIIKSKPINIEERGL